MKTQTLALLAGAGAGALAQDTNAAVVTDSPAGARYIARFEGAVSGRVLAGSDAFGLGVNFHVALDGLVVEQGPFEYYLNLSPVPEDGNCTGTGGRLDPFGRTAEPPCDEGEPQSCAVGDLSGKHGAVDGPREEISFHDAYTSLTPGAAAFFGNGSFVVQGAAGGVACASFRELAVGEEVGEAFVEEPEEEEPEGEEPEEGEAGEPGDEEGGDESDDGEGGDDSGGDFDFGDEFEEGGDEDEGGIDGEFGGEDEFDGEVDDGDFDFGGDLDEGEGGDFDFGGDSDEGEGGDFEFGDDLGDGGE